VFRIHAVRANSQTATFEFKALEGEPQIREN